MRNTNPSKTVPIYLISTDLIRVMTIRPCFLLTSIQRKTEYFHNLWKNRKTTFSAQGLSTENSLCAIAYVCHANAASTARFSSI